MCSALMKQSEKLPLQVEDYMTDCLIALLEFMSGGIKDVAARYYYTSVTVCGLPVRKYGKSNCTCPGIGVGGGSSSVDKMLKFYV